MKSQQKTSTQEIEIQIQEPQPKTKVQFEPIIDSPRRQSTRRKSKSILVEQPISMDSKKYNLRSRPSDLIKFDSPVSLRNNLDTVEEDGPVLPVAQSPFSVRKARKKSFFPEKIKEDEVLDVEDKENNMDDDFFRIDLNPLCTWKSRPSVLPASVQTPSRNSINTPSKLVRDSLDVPRFSNVSNSPLLKIALISTQSKRLSINSLNRLFD